MKSIHYLAASVFLLKAVYCDSYPAEYPFENELTAPPAPRAQTPSYTFTDGDVGGYIYTYAYMRSEIKDFPFSFHYNSHFNCWGLVNLHDAPIVNGYPLRDVQVYNCTAKGDAFLLSEETFPGIFKGETVCEKGECCNQWYGTYGFWGGDAPDTWMLDKTETEYDTGTCSDGITEPMYCLMGEWWSHAGCIEAFVSESERVNSRVVPCYDISVHWYFSCPVYKVAGIIFDDREPAVYNEESSPEENTAHSSFWHTQDKVCHPYSYYFPDFAKTSSTSTASTASTASEVQSSESSASSLFLLGASIVFAVVL